MLHLLCEANENRCFHAVADSAYGGKSVYLNLPDNCDLTSRLGLDARLHDAAPARRSGTNGRPRKRGPRLPTPRAMLHQRGRRLLLDIYGRRDCARVVDRVAYLYAMPDCAVRVVAVEPLRGGRKVQAFYSTDATAAASDLLTWYALRWSIEEAFQNAKSHLGFEEPQGWSRRAVERTAPTAMLLHSLIVLWFARTGQRSYRAPRRPWYRGKTRASFADMLATLRQESVREQVSAYPLTGKGNQKVLDLLIHAAKQAA